VFLRNDISKYYRASRGFSTKYELLVMFYVLFICKFSTDVHEIIEIFIEMQPEQLEQL